MPGACHNKSMSCPALAVAAYCSSPVCHGSFPKTRLCRISQGLWMHVNIDNCNRTGDKTTSIMINEKPKLHG
eukprot:m.288519 g.288519  ORF g.288519 m.288519 type:complete len:72 (+) comp16371_c1_seq11:5208-5423(+)